MKIEYKNESKREPISELRSGDVFLWDENAWLLLDHSKCDSVDQQAYFCAKLDNGCVSEFKDDDYVMPLLESLLTVQP